VESDTILVQVLGPCTAEHRHSIERWALITVVSIMTLPSLKSYMRKR